MNLEGQEELLDCAVISNWTASPGFASDRSGLSEIRSFRVIEKSLEAWCRTVPSMTATARTKFGASRALHLRTL